MYFFEVSIHFKDVASIHKCSYVNIVKYNMYIVKGTNIVCYHTDVIPYGATPLKIASL